MQLSFCGLVASSRVSRRRLRHDSGSGPHPSHQMVPHCQSKDSPGSGQRGCCVMFPVLCLPTAEAVTQYFGWAPSVALQRFRLVYMDVGFIVRRRFLEGFLRSELRFSSWGNHTPPWPAVSFPQLHAQFHISNMCIVEQKNFLILVENDRVCLQGLIPKFMEIRCLLVFQPRLFRDKEQSSLDYPEEFIVFHILLS